MDLLHPAADELGDPALEDRLGLSRLQIYSI